MGAEKSKSNLRVANQWARPKPGTPKVFLSVHAQHIDKANRVKQALINSGIDVVLYHPENRWPDGPIEMLKQIVTECHCVVYIGPYFNLSQYVRFELKVASEFNIRLFRVNPRRSLRKAIDEIKKESRREPPYDLLWGRTVSRAISNACMELETPVIAASEVKDTGRTGLDLFGRDFRILEDFQVETPIVLKLAILLTLIVILSIFVALIIFLARLVF